MLHLFDYLLLYLMALFIHYLDKKIKYVYLFAYIWLIKLNDYMLCLCYTTFLFVKYK